MATEIDIKNFVDVQIAANTRPIQIDKFLSLIFIGDSARFTERVRIYRSTTAMIDDGFRSTDPEYIAATAALSQTPSSSRVYIGRREAVSVTITPSADAITGDKYSFSLKMGNDTASIVPTISPGDTPTEIVTAVKAAITAAGAPFDTLTQVGTTDLTLSGVAFAINTLDPKYTQVETITETYADAVAAARAENDDWYGLTIQDQTVAVQTVAAGIATSNKKFFAASNSHADNIAAPVNGGASSTDDLLGTAKDGSLEMLAIYSSKAAAERPECSVLSKMLSSERFIFNNWAFKSYVNVTAESVSETEYANVLAKNGNVVIQTKNVSVFQNGKASSGEWANVIIGIQILTARIQEELFNLQLNNGILTFSNPDLQLIRANIEGVLARYQPVFILEEREELDNAGNPQYLPGFEVIVPKRSQISTVDIANRELNNVTFTAWLAGAINFIGVQGTVQY